jgi:orotate phosphoribosyltransferase
MTAQETSQLLARIGAVITGSHIVYTSGRHGTAYVNKDAIYPHTRETSQLCRAIAETYRGDAVEVVLGPAVGGTILSQWVAHHLSEINGREVLAVYADKGENDGFVIRRGYDRLMRGKRVLLVEDVLTTGGSAKKVVEAARGVGAEVVGLGAICNRGGVTAKDLGDIPRFTALLDVRLESWEASECPACQKGVPVNTSVGHGKEFLARQARQK